MDRVHVQYGCGLSAPKEWVNFDASPTLRIQKIPFIGTLLKSRLGTIFPANVIYGDIVKGLPIKNNSCDGVYCSHILEHLSLYDFRIALNKTYNILKENGIFRCVVPDLEYCARRYLSGLENGDSSASIDFMDSTMLGLKARPAGLKSLMASVWGNSHHLWMWDFKSLSIELQKAGFRNIRACRYNDCADICFKLVEDESRFRQAVAIECTK